MSLKIHLMVVCFIVVAIYLLQQWMIASATPPAELPRRISVIRINLAPGCASRNKAAGAALLARISASCNGKIECDIPMNTDMFGDLSPDCINKPLEVEYRCFSYDRPWTAHASSGEIIIHCDGAPA